MSLIELDHVSYTYPTGVNAVDDVSVAIDSGEAVAIIGQNGAGKTTTVKMINGLIKPTTGSVLVRGVDTKERTAAQTARYVGYVFQNPDDQIFNNTVRKEIEYGLRRLKLDDDDIGRRVRNAAALTGMVDVLDENPYDLPLSVRKFVTMTSVMAFDPDVIIFDEPTAGQDVQGLRRIATIVGELRSRGKALITITHDMEFVAEHFERVIVMANRRVVTEGPAERIFYDRDSMLAARLSQPGLPHAASTLGIPDIGLSVDRFAERLRQR